jgi:hypothetical protein
MKSIHTSPKALIVWDLNLIWFVEDEEYSYELKNFNHVRS